MKLRCWPGAIAYITHPGEHYGRMVEVLRAENSPRFRMPDGQIAETCAAVLNDPSWVVRFIGAPVMCPTSGGWRQTHFVQVQDRYLRPITPPPGTETETVEEVLEAARGDHKRTPAEIKASIFATSAASHSRASS